MFEALGEKLEGVFRRLRGQATLSDDNIKDAMREVRMALLEADVNYLVVKDFVNRVRDAAVGQDVVKGVNPAQMLFSIVHKELVAMMTGDATTDRPFIVQPGKRNIILMLGLQGAGKTTFCGKLATYLLEKKTRPLMVACDVYRPAAIEQLKQVGKTVGVPVFTIAGSTSVVDIVRGALKQADASGNDVIIVDTAGRLHIDEVKMDELVGLRDAFKPDYTFLVADAMTGQDAVNSAKAFNEQVGIDGVCLTKLDGDARGGAALSIKAVTGKPIVFVGMGEKPGDLEAFHPDRAAQRILGMGDVVSLVEKAQKAIDEKEVMNMTEKLGSGKFNYNDFIAQMKMIKRMGSLKGLLGMIPGVGSLMKDVDNDVLTRELKRVEAMILSMTKDERENPDLVKGDGHRRDRIAKGSGHTLKQVNELVKQFESMRAMMQSMAGGMMGGAPGGAPPPGGGGLFGGGGGMLGGLGGLMGGGGAPPMPDPSQILGEGGVPKLPPGGIPGMAPGMPGYKKYQQLMKMQERQKGTNRPTKKKRR